MPTIIYPTCIDCGGHEATIGRIDDHPWGFAGPIRSVELVCPGCGHRGTIYRCTACNGPMRRTGYGAESEHYTCERCGAAASYSDR